MDAAPQRALETIANDGPRSFYEGALAREIAGGLEYRDFVIIGLLYRKLMRNPAQEDLLLNTAAFKIVATQHGVAPSDPNN